MLFILFSPFCFFGCMHKEKVKNTRQYRNLKQITVFFSSSYNITAGKTFLTFFLCTFRLGKNLKCSKISLSLHKRNEKSTDLKSLGRLASFNVHRHSKWKLFSFLPNFQITDVSMPFNQWNILKSEISSRKKNVIHNSSRESRLFSKQFVEFYFFYSCVKLDYTRRAVSISEETSVWVSSDILFELIWIIFWQYDTKKIEFDPIKNLTICLPYYKLS